MKADISIAVVGLGYVGLPVAVALARKFPGTIGLDISARRISQLRKGSDPIGSVEDEDLQSCGLVMTDNPEDLKSANFFVVAVPTPVDENHNPDLTPLKKASYTVGSVLKPGDIVVYESTVYPGVTEDICGPVLENASGLKQGIDFKLAYSPERINPGDKEHTLERITKVVSGEDEATLQIVADVYEQIIDAGVHRAPTIKVAEAAKVIENTQRDLNIALMNELAIIFEKMNISTRDVLAAANTKWNFLPFRPGLVGGHCIGVDPYYLTTKAEQLGYHPQVILAGRRINDGMGAFIVQHLIKMLANNGSHIKGARIGVFGITFKENVSDIRNSKVPDIISELDAFGCIPLVHDPLAEFEEVEEEYGIALSKWEELTDLDGAIFAVSHENYLQMPIEKLCSGLREGASFIDIKSALTADSVRPDLHYWSL
ncbi:MAG: nucleotide sugar dehydrogenase [Bdellovibrionales bacterium]|nr:nucleotide sugar dehydrogenase [Bdellovibrionales bacterium]